MQWVQQVTLGLSQTCLRGKDHSTPGLVLGAASQHMWAPFPMPRAVLTCDMVPAVGGHSARSTSMSE